MGMTEYEDEPVEGLPEHLPEGETMVWQGRPTVAAMGKRVFYIRHLTLYFGLLIAGHTAYRLMGRGLCGAGYGDIGLASGFSGHCFGVADLARESLCQVSPLYPDQ